MYEIKPKWKRIYEDGLVILMILMVLFLLVALFFFPKLFPVPLFGIIAIGILRKTFNRREYFVMIVMLAVFLMIFSGRQLFRDNFQHFREPTNQHFSFHSFFLNISADNSLTALAIIFTVGLLIFIAALFWDNITKGFSK